MEIVKIAVVGIVSAILVIYLKSINSELTLLALIASGILLLVMSVSYAVEFIGFFNRIAEQTNIGTGVFSIVIKILAVSYIIEFTATLIEDFGLKSIADKVVFAGKLIILTLSFPIIKQLVETVTQLV